MSSGFGENILVTGSNRGIGLAIVQLLIKNEEVKRVFAACRNPDKAEV
jgi:NAD(P)-dependent dehydrogenase (short-subunit alcohol dehydrogenase family)